MNTPAEWNWMVWLALGAALYGLGLLVAVAVGTANGRAERPGGRGRRG